MSAYKKELCVRRDGRTCRKKNLQLVLPWLVGGPCKPQKWLPENGQNVLSVPVLCSHLWRSLEQTLCRQNWDSWQWLVAIPHQGSTIQVPDVWGELGSMCSWWTWAVWVPDVSSPHWPAECFVWGNSVRAEVEMMLKWLLEMRISCWWPCGPCEFADPADTGSGYYSELLILFWLINGWSFKREGFLCVVIWPEQKQYQVFWVSSKTQEVECSKYRVKAVLSAEYYRTPLPKTMNWLLEKMGSLLLIIGRRI